MFHFIEGFGKSKVDIKNEFRDKKIDMCTKTNLCMCKTNCFQLNIFSSFSAKYTFSLPNFHQKKSINRRGYLKLQLE